jgi:FeS assembly protein IscX
MASHCSIRRSKLAAEEMMMAREITWSDVLEIAIQLQEKFPDLDPYSVRFTDMHKWITELPGFVGDPQKSNEGMLEAIQMKWHEEYEDAKEG